MFGPLRRVIPNFIRRSYVLKFGITLLVIGLVVGGIGIFGTDFISKEAGEQVKEDLTSEAVRKAEAFQSWEDQNKLVVTSLANRVRFAADQQAGDRLSEQMNSIAPDGERALLIEPGNENDPGVVVADSAGTFDNTSIGALPSNFRFEEMSSGSLVPESSIATTSIVGSTSIDNNTVVAFASSVRGSDRVVIYFANIDGYKQKLVPDETTVTYVFNANATVGSNTIVYDSTGSTPIESYGSTTVINAVKSMKQGTQSDSPFQTISAGDASKFPPLETSLPNASGQYVPSYANIKGTPYGVVVHTPKDQAFGFVADIRQYGFIAAIVAVLGVGIIGALLGRSTAASIDRLRRKSEEMERGNLDVDFETARVDNIGQLYDGMANMRDALRNQIVEAREARQEAERARESAEETSQHLQAKANEYRDAMQAVAAGDLSRRLTPSERNEAMEEIAVEFNSMMDEIETTVAQLKEFANEVAASSQQVTASAEEVRAASQNVTESIQQISDGADKQDETLQSVSGEMSGLSTTVEEIASLSNEVADISERTADTSQRGSEAAQEAIEGMNRIETESQEAVEQIRRLDEEMDEIDDLIEFVTDVANQTNRLALNANIEASRASSGDGDGGFGAVANEIKELAAETKEATEDMEESIGRVQSRADAAVDSVTTTGELIEENVEPIRSAVEALDEIAQYAEETNTGVQEISAATEQQAASTQQVVAMVDEAAGIAEQTSLASENVAAAAEEQTSAMTEVSNSASELSGQASRLSEKLDRFTTSDTDGSLDGAELTTSVEDGAEADAEFDAEFDDDLDAEFDDDLDAEFDEAVEDSEFEAVDLEPEGDDRDESEDDGENEDDDSGGLGGNDPATFGDGEN